MLKCNFPSFTGANGIKAQTNALGIINFTNKRVRLDGNGDVVEMWLVNSQGICHYYDASGSPLSLTTEALFFSGHAVVSGAAIE